MDLLPKPGAPVGLDLPLPPSSVVPWAQPAMPLCGSWAFWGTGAGSRFRGWLGVGMGGGVAEDILNLLWSQLSHGEFPKDREPEKKNKGTFSNVHYFTLF